MNRKQRRLAAKQAPASVDPARLLAMAVEHHQAGRIDAAERQYRKLLRADPDHVDALHLSGVLAHQRGDNDRAMILVGRAVERRPDQPQHHYNLGEIHRATGRLAEAAAAYSQAAALAPAEARIHYRLGTMLMTLDRWPEALEALRKAIGLAPGDAEAVCELGRCLERLGRSDESIEAYNTALRLRPDLPEAHFNLGVALQNRGRFEDAVRHHRAAIAARPTLTKAWYSLALNQSFQPTEADFEAMTRLAADDAIPPLDRAALHFGLGRLLDRRDEVDGAFTHYHAGNRIKAGLAPFDPASNATYIDRLIEIFDARFFADRKEFGDPSDRPVFIVGMPRSGSTLAEQILASHPEVAAAGEHDEMRRITRRLPATVASVARFPDCAADMTPDVATELAADYLASLEALDPPPGDARRVADKMLGNFLRLGLIALMFPNARIIHCRRDPLDIGASCYVQSFERGMRFTYDLAHLGVAYRHYERLMAHWRRVLPLKMLDLQYETLIADQEATSREIVEFCGLDWSPHCLAFHEQQRQVRTASFWQVRQPLYASSVGRWRRYEAHLGPLIEALEGR